MRIIGGKLRGKKIFFNSSQKTRPLRDFVRENIFNIITHKKNSVNDFEKVNILDLYSGFGSFGIECLSRNVNKVVFVEKDKDAVMVLKKNINNLKITHKAEINYMDIKNFIDKKSSEIQFDIVFLDPPYKDISYVQNLKLIKKKKILKDKHLIIIHREKKCDDKLDEVMNIELLKFYGRSQIIFGFFLNRFFFVRIFICSTAG